MVTERLTAGVCFSMHVVRQYSSLTIDCAKRQAGRTRGLDSAGYDGHPVYGFGGWLEWDDWAIRNGHLPCFTYSKIEAVQLIID